MIERLTSLREWLASTWGKEIAIAAVAVVISPVLMFGFGMRAGTPQLLTGAQEIARQAIEAFANIQPRAIHDRFWAEWEACRYNVQSRVDCARPRKPPSTGVSSAEMRAAADPLGWCSKPVRGLAPRCGCSALETTVCNPPLADGASVNCCLGPQDRARPNEASDPNAEVYSLPWKPAVMLWRTATFVWAQNAVTVGVFGVSAVIAALFSAVLVLLAANALDRRGGSPAPQLLLVLVFTLLLPFATTAVAWLLLGAMRCAAVAYGHTLMPVPATYAPVSRLVGRMSMFEISRRDLILGAAGAYAAFGLAKPIAFIGAAEAQTFPAQTHFKKYKVGDIEVISLYDGIWEKPHDENFIKGTNVEQTKAVLKAGGLTDAHVPIPFTVIAVKTGDQLVLIDSGTGGGQAGGPKAGLLAQSMAAAGLDPKAVKTIVISHFHGDHISGLMAKDTNAQMFPDAEIIVPAVELKWWTQPIDSIPQPRRGAAQRIQATLPTWKNVKVVDGEADLVPGVRAIPAFGHTQGHTAHLVSSGGKQLLVTADATNIQTLFVKNPEWQAGFDHVPDLAVETRKKLFDRAIADKAMVAGYHWGLPNVGTIAKDGTGYAFTPAA